MSDTAEETGHTPAGGGEATADDVRWLDEREQRVWRAFTTMNRRLHGALQRDLQRTTGLSGPDYAILVNLSEAPGGSLRAHELGAAADWEKSRVSHHLSRMAQRGLVERRACADDARYTDIRLTPAGRAAIVDAAPRHVARVREWFIDALTPEQLDAFGAACDAITARLADDGPTAC